MRAGASRSNKGRVSASEYAPGEGGGGREGVHPALAKGASRSNAAPSDALSISTHVGSQG